MKNSRFKFQNWPGRSVTAAALLTFIFNFTFLIVNLGATPFYGKIPNSDGSFQTNVVLMQAYPPANTWTVYGTNIVYGGRIITNLPNASGYFSNWCYPNTYRVTVPALSSSFFVNILDTTNFLSLAVYITNAPVVSGTYLDGYGLVTNWLGYAPVRPTPAGVTGALGYTPPTNTYSAFTNIAGVFATNNGPITYSQLPFTPPTNSYSALTNALGFVPGTNTIGLTTNFTFLNGTTNPSTAYQTNGILKRISTP